MGFNVIRKAFNPGTMSRVVLLRSDFTTKKQEPLKSSQIRPVQDDLLVCWTSVPKLKTFLRITVEGLEDWERRRSCNVCCPMV